MLLTRSTTFGTLPVSGTTMITSILALPLAALLLTQTVPATPITPPKDAGKDAKAGKAPEPTEPTLLPGSPAPFPQIEKFVKGEEISSFSPGNTYVIEFWATWCGPCKSSMPHLSEVQEKYADKGVRIISISDEKIDTVTKFLDDPKWAAKTRYTLCADPDRSAYDQYMKPALQSGIPCAFIVKDGTVQWIGHPMQMDEPLESVVAGSWNVSDAKTSFLGAAQAKKAQRRLSAALRDANKSGDFTEFMTMLDDAIAKADAEPALGLRMQKFQLLLGPVNQPEKGYELGRALAADFTQRKEAMGLNQLAWYVLDAPKIKQRDLPFALSTAEAAVTASGGKDGAILDTLARAQFESGKVSEAVATQKLAIENTPPGDMLDEMKDTLKKYESGGSPK
ncbi:MAG: TlpA family protein disulfide reductase [Phycisphaerae bacterium]|nr:TlpA family protein disulfide reductase [Phycisphaerae bacterium]